MRKALTLVFIFAFAFFYSADLFAQQQTAALDLSNYGVRIEPDRRLMAVLATLEAADVKTPLSAQGEKFRAQLRADSAALPDDLRQKIKTFVAQHKKRRQQTSDAELVAPFVSMAYALSPAPDLADPVVTGDLPGTVLDVLDFAPLVREYYRRSSFGAKINDYAKTYQTAADEKLRPSARLMASDLLDYLHTRPETLYAERVKTETGKSKSKNDKLQTTEVRERERRFFIVPEMLAPVGNINFLNIGDDYYAVVPPEIDLSASDVRRAFLQFVFDPLVLKNAKDIATFRPMIKELLDRQRQKNPNVSPDIYLSVSRSLVAAADARQLEYEKARIATAQARQNIQREKTDADRRKVSAELERFKQALADETARQLSEAYENGAVLSFYFADQLKGLEDSGFDIASSLRDMILSLETAKESDRLAQFAEARKRADARRSSPGAQPATTAIENPVTNKLIEIQKTINAKNYSQAETDLKQLLKQNPSESRVFYNMARVASFTAESIENEETRNLKLKEAQETYVKAVEIELKKPNPDKTLLSLSYVALAKIHEFFDETEYAVKIYEVAIKIGDVAGGAYEEAKAGKQRLLKNQ